MTSDETNKCEHHAVFNVGVCVKCEEEKAKDPVAINTGKELKPCLLCGDEMGFRADEDGRWTIWCQAHLEAMRLKLTQNKEQSIRLWNNAWAHKRIAALEKELNELRAKIS